MLGGRGGGDEWKQGGRAQWGGGGGGVGGDSRVGKYWPLGWVPVLGPLCLF